MKYVRIFVALIAVAAIAQANAQDANAQKALQKAQFMLRQAAGEKAELQTQVQTLQQQVDKLARELAATKSAGASAQQRTEEKYSGAIAQWKQRDGELSEQLAVIREQLKQQLAKNKESEAQLQTQSNNFFACYENNKKLYEINTELLARYERKGFGAVLRQSEPFTGLQQVEIENLVQDYRYRLDDLRVTQEAK